MRRSPHNEKRGPDESGPLQTVVCCVGYQAEDQVSFAVADVAGAVGTAEPAEVAAFAAVQVPEILAKNVPPVLQSPTA